MSTLAVDLTGDLAASPRVATGPEGVAQNIRQRLLMRRGEWAQRVVDGVPYESQVLGRFTPNRDDVIRDEVLAVQDVVSATVTSIVGDNRVGIFTIRYATSFDPNDTLVLDGIEVPT